MVGERDLIDAAVDEVSRDTTLATKLESVRWERDTFSARGLDGQDVVNDQIVADHDILIAVFGTRLGTPTPRAASGSAEEIMYAIENGNKRFKGKNVQVYFKRVQVSITDIDLQEVAKLNQFKSDLKKAGLMCLEFDTNEQLSKLVRMGLKGAVKTFRESNGPEEPLAVVNSEQSLAPQDANEKVAADTETLSQDEGFGYLDYAEIHETSLERAAFHMNRFGSLLEEFGAELSKQLSEIQAANLNQKTSKEKKALLNGAAKSINDFAVRLKDEVRQTSEHYKTGMEALNSYFALRQADDPKLEREEERAKFLEVIEDMIAVVAKSRPSIQLFADTVEEMPRVTFEMNEAKKRLAQTLSQALKLYDELEARLLALRSVLEPLPVKN